MVSTPSPAPREESVPSRGAGGVRRTVFLLVGAAIAGAIVILASGVYAAIEPAERTPDLRVLGALALVPMAAVGLLPGVRELEVAAARSLLDARDVVVPEPMRAGHRWRTALWTFAHQVVGVVCGLLVAACVLALPMLALFAAGRPSFTLGAWVLERPDGAGWLTPIGLTVAAILVTGPVVWAAGVAARWSAPVLLGPLGVDRLALAERRLAQEQALRALSRDLHDGVGHSLSAIALQAAAGRRLLERDHPRTAEAAGTLHTIAALAAQAVAELDEVLGAMRQDGGEGPDGSPTARRTPVAESDLGDLEALLAEHRARGLEIRAELDIDDERVPRTLSRLGYRVCAEGLANATKHGRGAVDVQVRGDGDTLRIRVRNAATGDSSTDVGAHPSTGRGLAGLAELLALVGGSLRAGPEGADWVLEAELPLGRTT